MRSPVALCHVSRGCYRHQAITSQPPAGEPWKNSRCRPRELPSPSSSQPLKPPRWCTQRKLRMWENRGYWLQVAGVHIQGMTSVSPDSYFLPTHRKSTKFLNSRYLVSFINCHLLMFRLPCLLFKKKTIYPGSLTCLFGTVFLALSEMLSPRLEVLRLSAK